MSRFIHARIYRGKDDDLIAWLDGLPAGERSESIREALRVGIGLLPPHESRQALLMATVRQAMSEALEGVQIMVAEQGLALDANEIEGAFGQQLDRMLSRLT